MKKSHFISISILVSLILLITFVPKAPEENDSFVLFNYDINDILEIEFKSEKIHYKLWHTPDHYAKDGFLWKVKILEEKGSMYDFYGNDNVKSLFDSVKNLKYTNIIENNSKKHEEYGLLGCKSSISFKTREEEKRKLICMGSKKYGEMKQYIWLKGTKNIHIIDPFSISSFFDNNIDSLIDKKVTHINVEKYDGEIRIELENSLSSEFPLIFKNTNGKFKIAISKSTNKWEIDKLRNIPTKVLYRFFSFLLDFRLSYVLAEEVPKEIQEMKQVINPLMNISFFTVKNNDIKEVGNYKILKNQIKKKWKIIPGDKKDTNKISDTALLISSYQNGLYEKSELENFKRSLKSIENILDNAEKNKAILRNQKSVTDKKKESKQPQIHDHSMHDHSMH